jgi:hypothetical protein
VHPTVAHCAAFRAPPQTTKRAGWVKRGVAGPESIADHMYRMGMMAFMVQGTEYDFQRCMQLALVHDVAECEGRELEGHAPAFLLACCPALCAMYLTRTPTPCPCGSMSL